MEAVGWDARRRLMVVTAICATIVVFEAIALVAAGSGKAHHAVVQLNTGATSPPLDQPRSVSALSTPPATTAPVPAPPIPQEVVATMPVVAEVAKPAVAKPASPAAAATPVPAAPTPSPGPVATPVPACRPGDITASLATDRPTYQQNDTVSATGVIRNVSGHDCTAPGYRETVWCDGGNATCISAAGPINPTATPEAWPAGAARRATETWAFGQGDHPFTPHPGTGTVRFVWHLSEDGSVATASASFEIAGPPAATTTSTTTEPTTSTTIG